MTRAGFDVLPDLDERFIIDDDILTALKSDGEVYNNFLNLPELYTRIRISNIQKQRKNEGVFKRKLANFIKSTKANKTPGNWNDYGRL